MTSEQITVTEADREAAAEWVRGDYGWDESAPSVQAIIAGKNYVDLAQAFARHRTEAEARVLKHAEASPAVSDDMVERVARAIYEADDPWSTVWEWPVLAEGTCADKYRDIARAAIAAMSPQQVEPVAWMYSYLGAAPIFQATRASYSTTWTETPLYRHPPISNGKVEPVYRHKTRGTTYTVIGDAELQMSRDDLCDGALMVVYRGDDGKLWVRNHNEFHDGRFEQVNSEALSELIASSADEYTCATCSQLKECHSAFGETGQVGIGCADWSPGRPETA